MRKRRPPTGSPPEALAARSGAQTASIHVFSYGADDCREPEVHGAAELTALRADGSRRLWIDVQGLDDAPTLQEIARIFDIHPLALADAVNTPQRPKAQVFGEQFVLVTQMVRPDERLDITVEQLTVVVGANFVITFQEIEHGDVLDPVRARLRAGHGALRASGPDYLAYAIADTVIDGYFPVLELLGDRLDTLESGIVRAPTPETLAAIHRVKRELLTVRRHLWPQRDAVASLVRGDAAFIGESTRLHLRDCYDHTVQLIDVLETYRELSSSLMDAYISSVSHRLNEVMKVLTVISTVFMPLSFLAGLYGMNFEHMPGLGLTWAFPALVGSMSLLALGMLALFWRRGWIGGRARRRRRSRRIAPGGRRQTPLTPPASTR